jgi:integrase
MSLTLAPGTVSVIYRHVSAIFKAAVADRRIVVSPCTGLSVPKPRKARVVPMTTESVFALAEAMPSRYRAAVILSASTGLRLGEVLGLTVGHVDFLRRHVVVDRQLVQIAGQAPYFGPPKTDASYRTVPLPQVALDELAQHLANFPPSGRDGLLFTNANGAPVRRTSLWSIWQDASTTAGVHAETFHSLRHYYASLLIRHGESVKTVQERLGHASAVETLDTYSHLWPDSDSRTREAVDEAMSREISRTTRGLAQ